MYSNDSSGLECRFLADYARPLDLLQAAERVRNAPMASLELNRFCAEVGNVDRVGPEKIAVARRRPLETKRGVTVTSILRVTARYI